ncbi:hypothetical protein [Endozoicomonas sp. ONNA1]|uniref:hypothetical protein n=1 Tax=Endozoicomonas sp. ONNA1 TaxID=2828740 RepID=UPI002148796D|nr:hypothetical protein [Endozoicomonas sp. ONNA1]
MATRLEDVKIKLAAPISEEDEVIEVAPTEVERLPRDDLSTQTPTTMSYPQSMPQRSPMAPSLPVGNPPRVNLFNPFMQEHTCYGVMTPQPIFVPVPVYQPAPEPQEPKMLEPLIIRIVKEEYNP